MPEPKMQGLTLPSSGVTKCCFNTSTVYGAYDGMLALKILKLKTVSILCQRNPTGRLFPPVPVLLLFLDRGSPYIHPAFLALMQPLHYRVQEGPMVFRCLKN